MSESASKLELRRRTDCSPELYKLGWYHTLEFPDGTVVEGVQSAQELHERWSRFPLPADLSGKRLLDIGAWDGWFSFEAERRGASVVSIDCVEVPNLLAAKERLGSNIDYRVSNLFKIPALQLGSFDYVLFLGVLYHVKHPMLALEIVCALTREVAIVESAVIDGPAYSAGRRDEIPTLEFFETDELGGHLDNWFGPSVQALLAMCRAVGFARVELLNVTSTTASVACFRRWTAAHTEPYTAPAPVLTGLNNTLDLGINATTGNDDYLAWWFTSEAQNLTRFDLECEVGGFGCPAVSLVKLEGNAWTANTVVPPGLRQGWAECRLRTRNSPFSGARRIAMDMPPRHQGELAIEAVQDGSTWSRTEIQLPASTHAVLWIRGLSENADRANVVVKCNGRRLPVDYVGEEADRGGNSPRQINARIIDAGEPLLEFTVHHAGQTSRSFQMRAARTPA